MEFDKSRVFTALNADELKIGSKIYVALDLLSLQKFVRDEIEECKFTLEEIKGPEYQNRFVTDTSKYGRNTYTLAYLIKEPEEKKLKWQDLKIGDIIKSKHTGITYLITAMYNKEEINVDKHIYATDFWIHDDDISRDFEKEDC